MEDRALIRLAGGKAHSNASRAAHQPARPVEFRSYLQLEFGDPPQPFLDCDGEFHTRQIRANAAMDAEPEGRVAILLPVENHFIGALQRLAFDGLRHQKPDEV